MKWSSMSKPERPPGTYKLRTSGGFQWRKVSSRPVCLQSEFALILASALSVSPPAASSQRAISE